MASAWARAGHPERAAASCRAILLQHPGEPQTLTLLADLHAQDERWEDALRLYEEALQKAPGEPDLVRREQLCRGRMEQQWTDHPDGKLCLFGQKRFPSHRGGWGYALDALQPLHNREGVLFDGFLENHFCWEKNPQPYRVPWVGVLHNPAGMPAWYHSDSSPQTLLASPCWRQSIVSCRGLFTLSEPLAVWLRRETGKPVHALVYPTEIPALQFAEERFLANPDRQIVQVGWWLRRLGSLHRLPVVPGYRKLWLVTTPFPGARQHMQALLELDPEGPPPSCAQTREIEQVSDEAYDTLLSENLVFMHLYDAAANTAIVECIARATPLLVNRLPATEEYLGADYPLYFATLEEASAKATDLPLVLEAHRYLRDCPTRARLSGAHFLESLRSSAIYQALA